MILISFQKKKDICVKGSFNLIVLKKELDTLVGLPINNKFKDDVIDIIPPPKILVFISLLNIIFIKNNLKKRISR